MTKPDNVREVTLPEVVERTLSVVVAKPLGEVKTKISVGSDLPEFVRVDGKWEVVEVIVDGTATLKRGSKILVHDANAAVRLRVHRELHRSGTARQFLTHRYQPIAEPSGKKDPRILFLRQGDGAGWPEWAYAIEGAAEGLDAISDVRAALVPKFGAAVAPKPAARSKAKVTAKSKPPAANGKKKKR